MKKLAKKLTLNRETVRQLNHAEAARIAAAGGGRDQTNEPFCISNAVTCEELNCAIGF